MYLEGIAAIQTNSFLVWFSAPLLQRGDVAFVPTRAKLFVHAHSLAFRTRNATALPAVFVIQSFFSRLERTSLPRLRGSPGASALRPSVRDLTLDSTTLGIAYSHRRSYQYATKHILAPLHELGIIFFAAQSPRDILTCMISGDESDFGDLSDDGDSDYVLDARSLPLDPAESSEDDPSEDEMDGSSGSHCSTGSIGRQHWRR